MRAALMDAASATNATKPSDDERDVRAEQHTHHASQIDEDPSCLLRVRSTCQCKVVLDAQLPDHECRTQQE